MPADQTPPIVAAARHRRELTWAKAIRALRELERAGTPVSFAVVARAAGISRSWLHAQDNLRAQITHLREATSGQAKTPAIPASQRATDASLRRELSHALGYQRRTVHRPADPPAAVQP